MTLLELFSSFSYILASFVVFLYCFFYFFGISRTNRSEGDQLWVDLVITVCAKLKRILFKYSKWREPFRGKCTLTGLSEINVYKCVHTYIAFISIALTSSSFLTYCSTSRCNYLIIRDSLRKLPIRSQPLRRKLPIDTLICLCFCNWFHLDGNYKIVIGIACT